MVFADVVDEAGDVAALVGVEVHGVGEPFEASDPSGLFDDR